MELSEKIQFFFSSGSPAPVGPVVATGGDSVQDVTIDGTTYRVHTFTSSDNFVVTQGGQIEYLVVGGGGSGGNNRGGGGGAGGLLEGQAQINTGTHFIIIGAGGVESEGSESSINAISVNAKGGGKAGARPFISATTGGSGGGAGGSDFTPRNEGALGEPGQGHKGGNSPSASISGGGGGAGGQGGGVDNIGPEPGPGKEVVTTGSPLTFATGGAGLTVSQSPLNAPNNSGDGGRGTHPIGIGSSNGGSGIVIIRYPI